MAIIRYIRLVRIFKHITISKQPMIQYRLLFVFFLMKILITAFGYYQQPFQLVTPAKSFSIISLLQINPEILQL